MAFTEAQIDTVLEKDERQFIWDQFDDVGQKQRLIDHAVRLLTLHNQAALDETVTSESDLIRHDLAVALQAVHIGMTSKSMADGESSGPAYITNYVEGQPEEKNFPPESIWSLEALMYLTGNPTVKLPENVKYTLPKDGAALYERG